MQMFSINEKKFMLVTVNFRLFLDHGSVIFLCHRDDNALSTWVETSFEKANPDLSLGDKQFIYGAMQNSTRRNFVLPWLITKFDAISYVRDLHPIANFCWIWFSREFPTKWWNIASVTVCTFLYCVLPRWPKTCEWIWANKNSKCVKSSNDVPFVVWF